VTEISLDICNVALEELLAVLDFEPCGELTEVTAVSIERIAREPVLEPQGVAELVDQIGLHPESRTVSAADERRWMRVNGKWEMGNGNPPPSQPSP